MKIFLILFLILTIAGPLWMAFSHTIHFNADYRTANRASSALAPLPKDYQGAIVQVYIARAFNWRGIFALHSWLAIKPKKSDTYIVYQVVGWHFFRGFPALSVRPDIPDRYWFNQKPKIILDVRDELAEKIIPKINAAVKQYPYPNYYSTWPGPNSNTFIAYIAREVPELKLALPSLALGKDFTGNHFFCAYTEWDRLSNHIIWLCRFNVGLKRRARNKYLRTRVWNKPKKFKY